MPVGVRDAPKQTPPPPIKDPPTGQYDAMPTLIETTDWFIPEVKVTKALPQGYTVRPLQASDYDYGYLQCLAQLTTVGDISRASFIEYMQRHSDTYMPIVILDSTSKIVACGTLLIERKFIHNCGTLGHVEDIVVATEQRGTGLGKLLIEQLKYLALKHGCYKITLDCDAKNERFYAKTEFETKGLQMCIYKREL